MEKKTSIGMEESQIKYDLSKIPVINSRIEGKNLRVFKPKIDLQACKNEYNCIIFCPHNAITKNERSRPVINYDLCTGCLICLRECPSNAIFEERDIK